jgi:adenylosuccinate synthase
MDSLRAMGLDVSPRRVKLSGAAHVILPGHQALDAARETAAGSTALGTTRRGIGPAYSDKAARTGLRCAAMVDPDGFAEAVRQATVGHNELLARVYDGPELDVAAIAADYRRMAERLAPHVADVSALLGEALASGRTVLCEGAQGTLLDLDHGTYPYVTSSSPLAGGALTGLGFGPAHVSRVIGVVKAYATRVGAGPFPTELSGGVGERLRQAGDEYGTTTGRPRRCGWLDLPILRYAARVNGLSEMALTKLDVLSGLGTLQVAVAYERYGERTDHLPAELGVKELARWTPVYEEWPGWVEDLGGVRRREDLPAAALAYVTRIEEEVGLPVTFIGVGPEREQAIV